jgi:predicted nucleotidyltransferase
MIAVDEKLIDEIIHRIVKAFNPEKIILFGSRARGEVHVDSDIDLLVIANSPEPRYRRSSILYGVMSDIIVPMDILVYTPQEVEEWKDVRQAFVTTAVREGWLVYENTG